MYLMEIVRFDLKRALGYSPASVQGTLEGIMKSPGKSFLIGAERMLVQHKQILLPELRMYLLLAASRSYALYMMKGILTLPLELSPFSTKMLDNNGLVKVRNNKVFFKFEEETKRQQDKISMALNFDDVKGSAIKGGSYYKWTPGENRFRMVGGILPRYLYWVAGEGKDGEKSNMAFECLGFDRDQERFTNVEMDWVQRLVEVRKEGKMVPAQCAWSYTCLAFDRKDGKLKIMPLKKKMTEAIIASAKKLGDPTHPKTGYDIIVERVSTGSKAYNVEYQVQVLDMAGGATDSPLTESELETLADSGDITEMTPRESAEEQKARLLAHIGQAPVASGDDEGVDGGVNDNPLDKDAMAGFDDDIPF